MRFRSTAWKWFGSGCAVGTVIAALATIYMVRDLVGQAAGDAVLAPPPLAVAVSVLMTFFGLLIPLVALCGVVVVIVDGFARGRRPGS